MTHGIDTKDRRAVQRAVVRDYLAMFPEGDAGLVNCAFDHISGCFAGQNPAFQPVDTRYHDFEHTLQGVVCLVELLGRRHAAGIEPRMTRRRFELALLAILLHDTGYLKKPDDTEGTGAKYTPVHVARSAEFAARCLKERGFQPDEIVVVQNMIRCTSPSLDVSRIRFGGDLDRILGHAVGTADLLGQMAAPDYVDKLPALFTEFSEAAAHSGRHFPALARFASSEELIRGTAGFWENFVWPRINRDFEGLYRFLEDPYPGGPNWYLDCIRRNLDRTQAQTAGA
jgi:hypothetical protein